MFRFGNGDNAMMLQNLNSDQSLEFKARYKIVRLDDHTDVEGQIVHADIVTGECCVLIKGEQKSLSFGSNAIRILPRR